MKILNLLTQLLFIICVTIIVTGGTVFKIGKNKIGMASLDAWAIGLGLILLIAAKKNKLEELVVYQWFRTFFLKIKTKKSFYLVFLFFMSSLLFGHLFKHWSLNTHAEDVVYVNQSLHYPISSTSFMKCDICKNGTRFGEHIGATLLLVAPIVSYIQGEEIVIFIQVFLYALALFLLIKFGPLENKSDLLTFAFIIFISHRALKGTLVWDFKEDHLGSVFLLLTWLSIYKRKIFLALVCVTGTLLSKEHTPFILPLITIPIWFEKDLSLSKRERLVLIGGIIILSIVWLFSVFGVLLPEYQPTTKNSSGASITKRLGIPGKTKKEILMNLFFNPLIWFKLFKEKVLTSGAIKYCLLLYVPFIYFLRKRWWWIVATFSVLAMNLISTFSTMRMMIFHYENFILPTLMFGTMLAISKSNINLNQKIIALLLALIVSGKWPGYFISSNIPTSMNVDFFEKLPNDGKVSATGSLLAQVTHLENIAWFDGNKDHIIKNNEGSKYLLIRKTELNLVSDECDKTIYKMNSDIILYKIKGSIFDCRK